VFVVRIIHGGQIAEFFNVKAGGTYNNHRSQNSFDESASSIFWWLCSLHLQSLCGPRTVAT